MISAALPPKYGRNHKSGCATLDGANSVQQPLNRSKKEERETQRSDYLGIYGSCNDNINITTIKKNYKIIKP